MLRNLLFAVALVVFPVAGASSALADPGGSVTGLVGSPPVGASETQGPGTSTAQRQKPTRYDETVVVTADREVDDIRNVGSSVSVITRDEIAASGARWLLDALQFVPGVNVVRSGPAGSLTQIFMRGTNTGHTLFLIDGVKVNSPTTGGYDTAGLQIAADQIERIEVVRGPQSTLYGSQAIGGVINVITRRGSSAGTWGAEVDGGSFSTGRFHTWGMGGTDSVQLIGGVSYFNSGGFSGANENDGNVESDGYENLTYNGRVDYASQAGVVLRGFVRGFDLEVDFDGFDFSQGPVDSLVNVQTNREIIYGGAAGWQGARASSMVEVSVSDAFLTTDTPDDFFLGFELDSSIRELDWQNEFALPAGQTLVAGLEYRREQANSVSRTPFGEDGFEEKVDVVGVYAQDRIRILDRATFTGGVRYEDHSAFGTKWTGRATGTVDVTEVVRVHGSVGSGFKAPTLNDLFFPGFSNPDLLPESSVGVDIGVEAFLPVPRVRVDVTAFYNDITDLIEFDFVAGRPENIGNATTSGMEVSGEWTPSGLMSWSANYTFTAAKPEDSDDQLIRRPRHQGSLRATLYPSAALRVWTELRVKGESFDSGVNGREALDGFALVNVAADYDMHRSLVLRARIDNLFDTDYEEVIGFGTVGVSGYFGVTVTVAR